MQLLFLMRISDENLRGRAVISADGHVVGTIETLHVETDDWRAESLRVELRNNVADRIGVSRSMFRHAGIDLPVRLVQSVGDTVVLNVPLDHLRSAVDTGPAEAKVEPKVEPEHAPFH